MIDAHACEARVDLCRLEQSPRSVVRQAAHSTCAVETVEARPVRVQSGGGQWAGKVSAHAEHLQPRGSRGRLRHEAASEKVGECMRKRVNVKVKQS